MPDELDRDANLYRDHALVGAQDHCHYQYAPQCDECDVKAACDGFHGDYADLFGRGEARPIRLGLRARGSGATLPPQPGSADERRADGALKRHLFVHHNLETAVGFTSSNQWTISGDGQVLTISHTDLASRVWTKEEIGLAVRAAGTTGVAPVRAILFPFWHDKASPQGSGGRRGP